MRINKVNIFLFKNVIFFDLQVESADKATPELFNFEFETFKTGKKILK